MPDGDWTFLTNYGLVLLALARRPDLRLRDVAETVGITERAVQDIVNDMVEAGYVERTREGRRNRYLIHGEAPLRHALTEDHTTADLFGRMISQFHLRPREGSCEALVLACSDYRFMEGLRQFLAAQGLLAQAEVVLWPGGGAALNGPGRPAILAQLTALAAERSPGRLLLVAHQDCSAEGILRRPPSAGTGGYVALARSRRRALARVERKVGLAPELWFMDRRRTRQVVVRDGAPNQS